jgi:hypothetical protein
MVSVTVLVRFEKTVVASPMPSMLGDLGYFVWATGVLILMVSCLPD